LEEKGLVNSSGDSADPPGEIFCSSPLVIAAHQSQETGQFTYLDALKTDNAKLIPDPKSSGLGFWILSTLAALHYQGGPCSEVVDSLWKELHTSMTNFNTSAREVSKKFLSGQGDLLITYEREAKQYLYAADNTIQIYYPPITVLCQHYSVTIPQHIRSEQETVVHAFAEYLKSTAAQDIFSAYGFRDPSGTGIASPSHFQSVESTGMNPRPKIPGQLRGMKSHTHVHPLADSMITLDKFCDPKTMAKAIFGKYSDQP